jgi:hypothetical protein
MDGGRIVEDGSPEKLYQCKASRFRCLLEADEAVQRSVWSDPVWRTFQMHGGRLRQETRAGTVEEGVNELGGACSSIRGTKGPEGRKNVAPAVRPGLLNARHTAPEGRKR